tara:strand:+ start:4650 stop:4862 length:213 start_codon:yes stop_codon:yes gene_type:complete
MDAKKSIGSVGDTMSVSIHAPVMDAKASLSLTITVKSCFNPRARDGREIGCSIQYSPATVSIHAPVMDAN